MEGNINESILLVVTNDKDLRNSPEKKNHFFFFFLFELLVAKFWNCFVHKNLNTVHKQLKRIVGMTFQILKKKICESSR